MATRTTALTLVALTVACGDVAPLGSGTLDLQWRVAPNGCEDAGVDVVELRATGPHAIVERFACSREGITVTDITPGSYRLDVLGFDVNGVATFRAEPIDIDVTADTVATPPEFRLIAAPASVDVRWTFSNGRVCGANDAAWISVSAFDQFDYEVARTEFSCDDGGGLLPALRAGSYQVQATALDASARPVARGTSPVKLGRGDALELDVELEAL